MLCEVCFKASFEELHFAPEKQKKKSLHPRRKEDRIAVSSAMRRECNATYFFILSGGSLDNWVDEERSQLREVL